MVFKVLAFVVFVGLADSYGIPWFKHSHDDCGQDYPHYHQPSPHDWNHPHSSHGWNWHPWHASGPHLITTYSPVLVYPTIPHEEPTTTEVVTEEPPQGTIGSDSAGTGVLSLSPAEEDDGESSGPQESDTAASDFSTTEPPTTPAYKVKPLEIKPDYYHKSVIPVHEGKYVAKTLGSVHIAPLQGHAHSVTVLNAEPAPGTV
ncbi:hypothetical protein ACFFRR_004878 [Megaselia abdita]